jgi:hypothetical protein
MLIGDCHKKIAITEPMDGHTAAQQCFMLDGLDVQLAKEPLISLHAQQSHNACTSWDRLSIQPRGFLDVRTMDVDMPLRK